MFVLGVVDVVMVFTLHFVDGYWLLIGAVFCAQPTFMYLMGSVAGSRT